LHKIERLENFKNGILYAKEWFRWAIVNKNY
jgi:hypothetical protein